MVYLERSTGIPGRWKRNNPHLDSEAYIKAYQAQYVVVDNEGNVRIKNSLEQCDDAEVVRQIPDIRFNTPELFID